LSTFNTIEREIIENTFTFTDPLSDMFGDDDEDLNDLIN